MPYIYKITNQLNQKCYIGKTTALNPEERWKEHKRSRNNDRCKQRALYRALNKYGIDNFVFEILEEVSLEEINEKEEYYIQFYNSYHKGYNETLGGDGTSYLILPEQEICKDYLETLSIAQVAQKYNHDRETIKKILYKKQCSVLY